MKAKRSMACLLVLLMLAGLAIPTVFADDSTVHIADAKDLKKLAENCRLDSWRSAAMCCTLPRRKRAARQSAW